MAARVIARTFHGDRYQLEVEVGAPGCADDHGTLRVVLAVSTASVPGLGAAVVLTVERDATVPLAG